MNININDYIPTHKYIRLYESENDYNEDVNNQAIEECAYSLVNKNNSEVEQEYTPSTRTTNNDNLVKLNYFDKDKINIWAGLSIIWGYFGFKKVNYEYDGEQLIGGNFTFVKPMTIVKEIPDGYTLQHINDFLRYSSSNSITEIQLFDTTNIKSASYVFYHITNSCKINSGIIKNWNNLKTIISNFTDRLNIYNNLNDGEVINFSSLKEGFINHNKGDKIHLNANNQFNKLIKFQFGSLLDNTFFDNLSYSIIKILHNKGINEYNFSEYILDLNKDGCEITHYVPIYDGFTYNFDNELNGGFILHLLTDYEDTNKICNITINIINSNNKLHLIGDETDINNKYTINITNDVDISDFNYEYIDDKNIIINKEISSYNGLIKFNHCNISKDIVSQSEDSKLQNTTVIGNISNVDDIEYCTITGNINNDDSLYTYLYGNIITGNVNGKTSTSFSNNTINGDFNFKTEYNYSGYTTNNLTVTNNTHIQSIGSQVNFSNCTFNTFEFEGYRIGFEDSNVEQFNIVDNDNNSDYDIELNNSVINNFNINKIGNKGLRLVVRNMTDTINIDTIDAVLVYDSNVNFNITQFYNDGNGYYRTIIIENSIVLFNDDISLRVSKRGSEIEIVNSFNPNNDYIFKFNNAEGYISNAKITYNKDTYDYPEAKTILGKVDYTTVNSNIPIYDIYGYRINATLSNQTYVNLYCKSFTNGDSVYYNRINVIINSDTINNIDLYIDNFYNQYSKSQIDFSNCLNINTITLHVDESIDIHNSTEMTFDFTNCINLDSTSIYDFLISYGSKYTKENVLYIENVVYSNFTEEQVSTLTQSYQINVIHQE